jgi:hypothetical protein
MSEAPRDYTEILVYWPIENDPLSSELAVGVAHLPRPGKAWMFSIAGVYVAEDALAGWLPIPYPDEEAK